MNEKIVKSEQTEQNGCYRLNYRMKYILDRIQIE